MPVYDVDIIERQVLSDCVTIRITAESARAAGRLALQCVASDTDGAGIRAVATPDGQGGGLDPDNLDFCEVTAHVRRPGERDYVSASGDASIIDLDDPTRAEIVRVLRDAIQPGAAPARVLACTNLLRQVTDEA